MIRSIVEGCTTVTPGIIALHCCCCYCSKMHKCCMGAGAASNMNNVSEHNRISIGKTQNKVKRSTSLYTTLTVRKATVLILVAFLPTPIGSVSRIRPAVPVPYRIDGCRRDRRGSPPGTVGDDVVGGDVVGGKKSGRETEAEQGTSA